MCTAFTLTNKTMYFGRNMDIDMSFGEKVVIMPQNYPLTTKCAGTLTEHYALIGMANVTDNYPLYAEAVNEKGLCMAGLNFVGNAVYCSPQDAKGVAVTPYELIPFVLGKCANIEQVKHLMSNVDIVAIPFNERLPLATLHWIVSDNSGSLTIERTADGLKIYDNVFGVLTNNPPFPFHCDNIKQYLTLSAKNTANKLSEAYNIHPFALGMGAVGLPGDSSSVSRFVRTVWGKTYSKCGQSAQECVAQVMHILDSVAMVQGNVVTDNGKLSITTYSCCIDCAQLAYYYKTYNNNRLTKVTLTNERKKQSQLSVFALRTEQDIAEQ